jgi:poly-gamma-glutamate capsule biosynthesis protein CapA/YwtB (metallophosphatase superfamily)
MPRLLLCLLLCLACSAVYAEESSRLDFSNSPFEIPAEPEPATGEPLVLMFTGDTKLCGRTAQQIARHGRDYPFSKVAEHLRSADLCFGNCETAITDHPTHTPGKSAAAVKAGKAFVFKSSPAYSGPILRDAGFDILQLANNHAMDWCAQGLLDTMAALDEAGIAHVGAGADYAAASAPRIVEVNGMRVGFLAYSLVVPAKSSARRNSPGINFLPADYKGTLRKHIAALRAEADLVIVGFHWGKESTTVPNAQQRNVGRAAIDAGADLVIGTHTHSFQGIEFYGDGVIAYSLGNFVFTGASKLLAGGVLRVQVAPEGERLRVTEVALLPCWIRDGVPTPSSEKGLRSKVNGVLRATGSRFGAEQDGWLAVERLR